MARKRVDALDERVRTLRVAADRLREEYVAVRRRVHALEVAVEGPPDGYAAPTRSQTDSTGLEVALSEYLEGPTTTNLDPGDEATDEEVAAAIQAVEEDLDEEADDECGDDILIT